MASSGRILDDSTTGTLEIAPGLRARRLGFGAMRISGARNAEGVRDRAEAVALVRRVVERGVTFIDTANIYGYGQSEEIIREALHPYPSELVIATKAGFKPGKIEPGQTSLPPLGRPEHIREEIDKSLQRLGVDVIDLYQMHVPDPEVPYAETMGAFVELQKAGKVRHIGVSNVNREQLALARSLCSVVSVQNRYSVGDRRSEAVLAECERSGIAFLPWAPIITDGTPAAVAIAAVAARHGVGTQQVALAWLLQHSPVMLPIPGTSSISHADDNIDAAWLQLTPADIAELDAAGV